MSDLSRVLKAAQKRRSGWSLRRIEDARRGGGFVAAGGTLATQMQHADYRDCPAGGNRAPRSGAG